MIEKHCTHSWLGAFAGRLLQLRPGMGLGSAVAFAVENIHRSGSLDPMKAAEICAHNDFYSNIAGATRGAASSTETHSMRYREQFTATLFESAVVQMSVEPAPQTLLRV
jgi:hypothetical protein